MSRPNLRTITTTLVCLLLPLTILAGVVAAAFYKSINPKDIDITTDLAYLRQTLTIAVVAFAVLSAVIVGLITKMYHKDRNFSQAKLPLTLLIAVVGLLITILLVNGYVDSVQDQYRQDRQTSPQQN